MAIDRPDGNAQQEHQPETPADRERSGTLSTSARGSLADRATQSTALASKRLVPLAPLPAGTLLGKEYRIVNAISNDLDSIVYEAEDEHLGVSVCIKEYIPPHAVERGAAGSFVLGRSTEPSNDHESLDRFIREARALVRFHHPNIVRAHRVLEQNNTAYIVLDFERATTLRTWRQQLGRAPTQSELDRIAGRLLEALNVVHANGVMHRDIRPENIFIRSDLSPVLTGFAHASLEEAAASTGATLLLDDSDFVAPEIVADSSSAASNCSDVYGLAATMFFAMTGAPPPNAAIRLIEGTPVLADDLMKRGYRSSFVSAIEKGLTVNQEERPSNVADWLAIDTPVDPALVMVSSDTLNTVVAVTHPDAASSAGSTGRLPTRAAGFSSNRIATQFLTSLEALPDPHVLAEAAFVRAHLPAAILCAFFGLALYASSWSFAVSAILQVVAILLLSAGGGLTLFRFSRQIGALPTARIESEAEDATRYATLMIACILGLLALNPVFANSYVSNQDLSVRTLSFLIGVPTVAMLLFAVTSTPISGVFRWVFGSVNLLVLLFCVALLSLYIYVVTQQLTITLVGASLANSYLFLTAPVGAAALCIYIFYCRLLAIRAIRI